MSSRTDCFELMELFYEKFGVYPVIRHKKDGTGEWMFVLQVKSPADKFDYYRMGRIKKDGVWYINNLKQIPIGTVTFESIADVEAFKREQRKENRNEQISKEPHSVNRN